jgi:hypothetical protein
VQQPNIPRKTKTQDVLVGKFFHSWKDGAIHWQGHILGSPAQGVYLVQLFEWLMGEPSSQHLVRLEDMCGWTFYSTCEHMNEVGDREMRRERARERLSQSTRRKP